MRKYAVLGISVKLKSELDRSIPGLPPWIFNFAQSQIFPNLALSLEKNFYFEEFQMREIENRYHNISS